jgi:hypothetical protein
VQFIKEISEVPVEYRMITSALQDEAGMSPGAENLPDTIPTRELRFNQMKNLLPSAPDESRTT